MRAYLLGGLAWYGIPFGFATAMGLGCAALTSNPNFPTYPNPLSAAQNGAGLSAPATAITLLGKNGAVLMLVLLFMAVTSSTSAELIAVSSLLTFDVYKTYINPAAKSSSLVTVAHYGIIIYGLVLAAFCCILNAAGLNLTWLLTCLAIIVGGGSLPIGMILMWERMSTLAAIVAPWVGLTCGLVAWLVTTWQRSGAIDIATTGDTVNALAGNITAWGVGGFMAVLLSFLFPAKYASTDPKHIERSNKIQGIFHGHAAVPTAGESSPTPSHADPEKSAKSEEPASAPEPEAPVPTGNEMVDYLESANMQPMDPVAVRKSERLAISANLLFAVVAIVLVPFALFGTAWIYNKAFFTGWCVVSFFWVWVSTGICVIYPVVESTGSLWLMSRGLSKDMAGLFGPK